MLQKYSQAPIERPRMQKPEAYTEPRRTSKMKYFSKIANGWKPLAIFAKSSILDVRLGSDYAFQDVLRTFENLKEVYQTL